MQVTTDVTGGSTPLLDSQDWMAVKNDQLWKINKCASKCAPCDPASFCLRTQLRQNSHAACALNSRGMACLSRAKQHSGMLRYGQQRRSTCYSSVGLQSFCGDTGLALATVCRRTRPSTGVRCAVEALRDFHCCHNAYTACVLKSPSLFATCAAG